MSNKLENNKKLTNPEEQEDAPKENCKGHGGVKKSRLSPVRSDRLVQEMNLVWQIGKSLGYRFGIQEGSFLAMERASEFKITEGNIYGNDRGSLAEQVFDILNGTSLGGITYDSAGTFWRKQFSVSNESWFPTWLEVGGFIEGVKDCWDEHLVDLEPFL